MEGEKKIPQIVLKKCDICKQPVKSILRRKGRLYDEYICLEDLEKIKNGEYHVFKVKTDFMVQMEMAEIAGGTVGGGWLLYEGGKKVISKLKKKQCPQEQKEPIADYKNDLIFSESTDLSIDEEPSEILDFLSNFDFESVGIFFGSS